MTSGQDSPHVRVASAARTRNPVRDPTVERILRHSPHAIVLVDREGRIQHANGRAEPLLNSPTSDLVGQPLARFLVERDRARLHKRLQLAAAAVDAIDDLDVHLDRPEDGLLAVSFLPLSLDPEPILLLQLRDLTREKAERDRLIEREAEAHRQQAAENRKMIDLGKLISGVAHELRTPMTYVANNVALERRRLEALARSESGPGGPLHDLLELNDGTMRGVARIEHVLQELRPLTKNKPHRAVRMDLAELVMDALRTFRGAPAGGIQVTVDLQSTHPVALDREDMANVVLNLLKNASDAVGGSGSIHVETRNANVPPTIRVIDHGPGIPPEVRKHLFEPFYTTKPDGTGLGLFISRRTVEAHGGTLAAEDTPGGGATFVVRLPPP